MSVIGVCLTVTDHVLDPFIGLSLRVNKERPSARILNYDPVLDTQVVTRQTGNLPAANSDRVTERVN